MRKSEMILTEICKDYDLRPVEIQGRSGAKKSRSPYVVRARHHWWFRLKDELHLSFPEIAMETSPTTDHTSVIHGVRKFARQCGLVNWKSVR